MTALDSNILVAVMVASSSHHEEVMAEMANLNDDLCTTPTNIGELLRILTHPKVFSTPLKIEKAADALADLIECYNIRILDEDTNWWKNLGEIAEEIPGLKGNEVFDARIAICLRHHKVKRIFTRDSDFKKYSFLSPIGFKKNKSGKNSP
jgi:predicted nucleic acid-binding protein